jgi:hypothetical protein
VRLYLVGGSVLIDLGLRSTTLAIDFVADADDPAAMADLEPAMRALKQELDVNVEPASPADFLPVTPAMLARSRFVRRFGKVSLYYYHLATQVIAKAARGFEQDLADAEQLVRAGLVGWGEVEETWQLIRSSPTGWLRQEPAEIERRLSLLHQRLQNVDA